MPDFCEPNLGAGISWTNLFDLLPHIWWSTVALIVFFIVGPSRIREALTKLTKVRIAGLEFELESKIESAAKAREIDLSPQLRDRLARRLERRQFLITCARILWIDDNPLNNGVEIGLLSSFGATIDLALSDQEAREQLRCAVYDIVLSDMSRHNDEEAGKRFLPEVNDAVLSPPLIFYVGKVRPLPQGAFGLTTRPDELLHLILDALERGKS